MSEDLKERLAETQKEYDQGIEKGVALEMQKQSLQKEINGLAQTLLVLSGKLELLKDLTKPEE